MFGKHIINSDLKISAWEVKKWGKAILRYMECLALSNKDYCRIFDHSYACQVCGTINVCADLFRLVTPPVIFRGGSSKEGLINEWPV